MIRAEKRWSRGNILREQRAQRTWDRNNLGWLLRSWQNRKPGFWIQMGEGRVVLWSGKEARGILVRGRILESLQMQLESQESFEQWNIIIKQEVCIKQPHSFEGMHNPLGYRWTIIYATTWQLIDGWVVSHPVLLQTELRRISLALVWWNYYGIKSKSLKQFRPGMWFVGRGWNPLSFLVGRGREIL